MLKQTFQCSERIAANDSVLNVIRSIQLFVSKFRSLINENHDFEYENIAKERRKELQSMKTCNTCIHRYKYKLSKNCSEYYLYDSQGFSINEEEDIFYS